MDINLVAAKAITHFGKNFQIIKAIEELSELITALSRISNGGTNLDNVIEEIADVQIMTTQLRQIYGAEAVDAVILQKTKRLSEQMETPSLVKGLEFYTIKLDSHQVEKDALPSSYETTYAIKGENTHIICNKRGSI